MTKLKTSLPQEYLPAKRYKTTKKTLNIESVIATCERMGYDPIASIIETLQSNSVDDELALKTKVALLPYLDAKRNETTLKGDDSQPLVSEVKVKLIDTDT